MLGTLSVWADVRFSTLNGKPVKMFKVLYEAGELTVCLSSSHTIAFFNEIYE